MTENRPTYIKPTVFLSGLIGLIMGLLLTIPIVQLFVIFIFFAIGAIVVWVLKKNEFAKNFSQKDGIIIGSISGFISVICAAISFLPIILLAGLIFKGASGLISGFFSSVSAFIMLLILVLSAGFMNMFFNAGAALLILSLSDHNKSETNTIPQFKVEK